MSSTLAGDVTPVLEKGETKSLVTKPEVPDINLSENGPTTTTVIHEVPFATNLDVNGPVVTRRELWSYYLYYSGDNGVGPLGYFTTVFQSLASAAAFDATLGPGNPCLPETPSSACRLPWGNGTKSVSSVILLANGISFAIMTLFFTTFGSAADYGTFGRWLLLALTVVCWAAQFSALSLTSPDRWGVAMGLFMITFISYGATLVFYTAVFPILARNTPHARMLKEKYRRGEIDVDVYEKEESLEKNRISNISTGNSMIGYIVTLLLNLTILLPLQGNPQIGNYTLVMSTGYWVLTGVWWFIFQQPRPGPNLPKGESYLTIGWKQIWRTTRHYRKLPNTFFYLFGFFLLADALNTTVSLVNIQQNDRLNFSFIENTYLALTQATSSMISIFGFWYAQKFWKISTKPMFAITNVATIIIPFWGMLGIWTTKIGFHNAWEFWMYNIFFGFFQAPYYALSQTMMAELTPPGFDNMFFGLFGLSNRASSVIGPNVIQAIIDHTQNNNMGYPFLFALSTVASLVIWFKVHVREGKRDAVRFSDEKRGGLSHVETSQTTLGSGTQV